MPERGAFKSSGCWGTNGFFLVSFGFFDGEFSGQMSTACPSCRRFGSVGCCFWSSGRFQLVRRVFLLMFWDGQLFSVLFDFLEGLSLWALLKKASINVALGRSSALALVDRRFGTALTLGSRAALY